MPLLKIETNADLGQIDGDKLLAAASRHVAEALGKPEGYVMVTISEQPRMLFAGENTPTAYLELKSIGLPLGATATLSEGLCRIVEQYLGVAPERTYIEFADASGPMWGWKGGTF